LAPSLERLAPETNNRRLLHAGETYVLGCAEEYDQDKFREKKFFLDSWKVKKNQLNPADIGGERRDVSERRSSLSSGTSFAVRNGELSRVIGGSRSRDHDALSTRRATPVARA